MTKVNVFISHTSKDHNFVWELAKRMKKDLKEVANIFIDDWKIKVGDSIVRKVDEAAQDADFFIIVLSKNSVKQEWVKREIDIAFTKLIQKKSKILPVWLEILEEEVPPILLPLKAAVFKTVIIDEEEYKKLIEPILNHEKAKSLLKFQENVLDNIRHLDLILQKEEKKERPTLQEVQFALKLIKESPVYEKYFFSKLHSLEWFNILKLEGFFSPEKAPGPEPADKEGFYTILYWNVLDYLERISQKVKESGNEEYVDELLKIIKEVTEHHKQTKELDNYHIWSSFIRILSNLPNEKIPLEIIDCIPTWLDSRFGNTLQSTEVIEILLPKFLTEGADNTEKAERIIEHITRVRVEESSKQSSQEVEGSTREAEESTPEIIKAIIDSPKEQEKKSLLADIYTLREFFEENYQLLAEKCTLKVVKILADRVRNLVSSEYDETLYSFYDYEKQSHLLNHPLELLPYAIMKIMVEKARKEPEGLKPILKEFLKERTLLFPKLALFVIAHNMEDLSDLFWEFVKSEDGAKLFENTQYWGDELKKVLEKLGSLTDEQKEILMRRIEEGIVNRIRGLKDGQKRRLEAMLKQEIYQALSRDREFKRLYEEMKKVTNKDVELEPAIKSEDELKRGKSPLDVGQILGMENRELAEYLLKFKGTAPLEDLEMRALAEVIGVAIRTNPHRFTEDFEPFLNIGYLYVAGILEGLRDALTEGKPMDYEGALNYIERYMDRDEFWQDKFLVQSSMAITHTRVINAFCSFITEGLHSENPIPEKLFGKVEQIIHLILEKLEFKDISEEISDYVIHSPTTTLGRVIEAYIKFVLTVNRSSYGEKASVKNRFVEEYKKLLRKEAAEAYTFFGLFLSRLYFYIDKNFVLKTVKSMEKGGKLWEAFMQGYLFAGRTHGVYTFMKEHYEASLDYEFKNDFYRERLIEHISWAYLVGLEEMNPPSLFAKLIEKFDPEDINNIISFFYAQRDYLKKDNERSKQIRTKILKFWEFVYRRLRKERLSEEEGGILSNIVRLMVFLPELNEPYVDWLKLSSRVMDNPIAFSYLLDGLERFIKTKDDVGTARKIGEILLKSNPFPYPEKKIRKFITYLYETNDKEVRNIANQICSKYIEREIFFLKEICGRYNT